MNRISFLRPLCLVTPALLLAQSRGVDTAAQLRPLERLVADLLRRLTRAVATAR